VLTGARIFPAPLFEDTLEDEVTVTMKKMNSGAGYNERLFSGGLRGRLHSARFRWIQDVIARLSCSTDSVLELGCFDGKLIDLLPVAPSRYVGFDANWEGGLDLASEKWSDSPNISFYQVASAQEMDLDESEIFDIAVAMETLEHMSPDLVAGYLEELGKHTEGYLLVTVPNEKGLVFLAKWIIKRIFRADAQSYSTSELINATLGRMHLVARREHKGFDYDALVAQIGKHFDVIEVTGHPFGFMPRSLCFGIGIVARAHRERPLS